jgi:L-alanine-DL-glutamate epimerase-like enolase superfamily enzyme
MKIRDVEAIPFRIPYAVPLKWGLAGYLDAAEHVLVRIRTDEGIVGCAEATPRPTIYGESQVSIVFAVQHWFKPMLLGKDPFAVEAIWTGLQTIHWNPTAKGAVDLAIHDIQAKAAGVAACRLLGSWSDRVPVSWMIGLNSVETMVEEAQQKWEDGFRAFKVKVGVEPDKDIQAVRRLRERLGQDALIYVDGNQAYGRQEAKRALAAMAEYEIAMVEEPLPVWDQRGRLELAGLLSVPIMGDESVFTPHDVARELELGAIGVISIKTPRTGYYLSRKIIQMAEMAGIGCLVGSQAESTVGTLASAHFAAAFRNIRYPSEISYFLNITDSLLAEPIRLTSGAIELPKGPGFGIELDEEKLKRYRVDL